VFEYPVLDISKAKECEYFTYTFEYEDNKQPMILIEANSL
jgi:hypothetical protein